MFQDLNLERKFDGRVTETKKSDFFAEQFYDSLRVRSCNITSFSDGMANRWSGKESLFFQDFGLKLITVFEIESIEYESEEYTAHI